MEEHTKKEPATKEIVIPQGQTPSRMLRDPFLIFVFLYMEDKVGNYYFSLNDDIQHLFLDDHLYDTT